MKRKVTFIIFFLMITIFFPSCNKVVNKKPSNIEKKQKAPESLNSIYEGINFILGNLNKINDIQKKPEKVTEEQTDEKEKDKSNKVDKVKSKEEELNKKWDEIDRKIKKIHDKWNNFETEGAKDVVLGGDKNKVEDSLNNLTLAVENKDTISIVDNGSQMLMYIAPFFNVYKDELKGDICNIKYYVYQSFLMGEKGELEKALNTITNVDIYLNNLRQKIGKDQKKIKILEKLSLSIKDLSNVLNKNSSNLLTIKRDIILRNIEELEK